MKMFGYEVSSRRIDEHPVFNELAEPIRHRGNEIGCIVLHGIGGTPANIRSVAEELIKEGYSVEAPMLPGHGTTLRDFSASSDEKWLACAVEAYDRLKADGCTSVIPIGLSLGGILAGQVAARKDCAALVMISAPLKVLPYLKYARLLSPVFPYVCYGKEKNGDVYEKGYGQMYGGMCTRKLVDLNRITKDLHKRLPDISCPVCAIWSGSDNKVAPESADLLKKGLRAGIPLEEHTLENMPHGSTYSEKKETVAKLTADFIRKNI